MSLISKVLIALIALLHFYIAWFEIFAWTSRGPKIFTNFPPELFEKTLSMAANQGIYNACLAAGLVWSLCIVDPLWHRRVATCFLLMICAVGIFGAITALPKILFVQSLPALIAIVLVVMAAKRTQGSV